MKRIARLVVMAVAPLLMAALWMDRQPSHKPYQAPILMPPAGSVPVTGRELVSQNIERNNPVIPTANSLNRGKELFSINCTMCHGQNSAEPGPVGKKLSPPPPGLDHNLVRHRSDSHIFNAITFGFGRMPPFKEKISTEERWDLINSLRARK